MELDVFRMDVPDMDEPVKIGEIAVEKVGKKMSTAKLTAITSSLPMERGDRILPHPVIASSDESWVAALTPLKGWKSDPGLSHERDWDTCEVLSNVRVEPEIRQLIADTNAKPIWHPSIKSRRGDVYFRKVMLLDAQPENARLDVVCGGKSQIYINDRWVGEAKEWPEISSFRVHTFLHHGRNIVAVHVVREPRINDPAVLFLGLTVQTKFH